MPMMDVGTEHLLHQERKLNDRAGAAEKALTMKGKHPKKKGACHHCGKLGHYKRDCWKLAAEKRIEPQKEGKEGKHKTSLVAELGDSAGDDDKTSLVAELGDSVGDDDKTSLVAELGDSAGDDDKTSLVAELGDSAGDDDKTSLVAELGDSAGDDDKTSLVAELGDSAGDDEALAISHAMVVGSSGNWIMDSGATSHMCTAKEWFRGFSR